MDISKTLKMNLEKHNPHWKEKFVYDYPIKRELFLVLLKNIKNKQIITVSGLRRTGKTVIIKQLIDYLIEKSTNRTKILYFSFDEEQPKIEELINEFTRLANIELSNEEIFIFLDEIQKLPDWQDQIKYYYDNFKIKFIVSGSSSLFIRKKVKESLAGRSFDFHLKPLNFKEFLLFRNKKEVLEKQNIFKNEIKKEFEIYIRKQFIDTLNEDNEFSREYVKSILEKIIHIDIPKVFPIENEELLFKLLRIIATNPGMIIEYENLGKEIGINRITLSNYLFYLEEAFLIKKIYNYSKNMLTSEKKSKKFYINSNSFFEFLNSQVDESKVIENLIAIETPSRFFWRTPFKEEVDFILELDEGKKLLPVEVKYRNTILDKDSKGVVKFCIKNNLKEGLILTKDYEAIKVVGNIKISFVPVWKWMLET
ncbi:MAG: ATP-binding protein [Nanoarchaeota archaeon]|nr:ATP-binding protein [Nanoarchaeota archaeon]